MNRFARWTVAALAVLGFLAPLKFGTPVIVQSLAVPPRDGFEWLFFSWPNELAVMLAFAAFVWLALDRQRMMARVDALFVLPLVFLLTQAAAAPGSIHAQVTADTVMVFAVCVLLFYVAAWYVRDGAAAARIFGGLGLATAVVCVLALEQHFGGLRRTREFAALYLDPATAPPEFLARMSSERVFGTLVYPNALAGFLVVAFFPTLAWAWQRARNWDRRVKWMTVIFAAALIVWCLLLTGSRGGYVAFLAAVAAGLWGSVCKGRARAAVLIGAVLVLLAAVWVLAQRGGILGRGMSSVEARFDYWRGAMMIAREHFWLGTGPGTFGSIYPKYRTSQTEEAQAAHNSFLQVWSDSGVVAFVVFALMWAVALRDAFRLARDRTGDAAAVAILASLSGWVVHALVDFDLHVPGIALPVFALLGALQGLKPLRNPSKVSPPGRANWPVAAACVVVLGLVMWAQGRQLAAAFAHGRAHELERLAPEAALASAMRATELAPHNAHYWAGAAEAALALGRFEEAVAHYGRATEADPYRASYHWRLGRAMMAAGRPDEEVVESLRQAVALNPMSERYRLELARFEAGRGAAEESVRQPGPGLLQSAPAEQ